MQGPGDAPWVKVRLRMAFGLPTSGPAVRASALHPENRPLHSLLQDPVAFWLDVQSQPAGAWRPLGFTHRWFLNKSSPSISCVLGAVHYRL